VDCPLHARTPSVLASRQRVARLIPRIAAANASS